MPDPSRYKGSAPAQRIETAQELEQAARAADRNKKIVADTYYASKLGVKPTSGSFTNLVWGTGDRDAQAIIAGLGEGIFVTSFLGGNSNRTSGDYSMGIKGFYIKDGKIVHPVSEMNIAGNHLELWNHLVEVGNDPWRYSSMRVPTLCFSDVSCSGSQG